MTKQQRSARQAIKTDDVFKVKKKSSKKQNKSKLLKAKSRQALQQGRDALDEKFVQLHQQQSVSQNDKLVRPSSSEIDHTQQRVNVEDAIDQLVKL